MSISPSSSIEKSSMNEFCCFVLFVIKEVFGICCCEDEVGIGLSGVNNGISEVIVTTSFACEIGAIGVIFLLLCVLLFLVV